MANVEMRSDEIQRDKQEIGRSSDDLSPCGQSLGGSSLGGSSLGGPSLNGGSHGGQSVRIGFAHQTQDGAFDRFLSSAIVAILTILFSWRMLMLTSTDDPSAGQSLDQRTGQSADHKETTLHGIGKPHTPVSSLGSGDDFSTENDKRNMKSNSSVDSRRLSADHHIGPVVIAGQSSMEDGGFDSNSSCSSFHRPSAPADNSPEADIGEATDDEKWAERSLTPHFNSGELSGAANRYASNTISRRPQIFKAGTAADCDSNHINVKNGDYLDRKGDRKGENADIREGSEKEEEKGTDFVRIDSLKHPLPISRPGISSHFVRSHSAEVNSKEEGHQSPDGVSLEASAYHRQQMDRYQLVPMPTDEEMDFWGPDEAEEEEEAKDNGRFSRTGFHEMEPWDPIDYDDGSALEAYFEQDYFDSSEESEDSEFLCERRLETILEEDEEEDYSEEEDDKEEISEEEAEVGDETDIEEDEDEMDNASTEKMFTRHQDTRIMDEVLSDDVSYFRNTVGLQIEDGGIAEMNSEFDQHHNSIHTSYSPSVTDYFSSDSLVKLPKNSDVKRHMMTRGRIESHKVLSEVKDIFNALVQNNCGVQSGTSFEPEEKLDFDLLPQDVHSPFVSYFRTEAVQHRDDKWRFPLDTSPAANSFMQVTDLDELFGVPLLNSANEVSSSTALNASLLLESAHMEQTDRFLVPGDFGQRVMVSEGSTRNFGEATVNDDSCGEEVELGESVPQERAKQDDRDLWVSEATVTERTETFVFKTVFYENNSETVSGSTSTSPDETSKDSVLSPLISDFRKSEAVGGTNEYEDICTYEEHEQTSDLENESRPSPRAELTVQSMYPHTQNLLNFISSEVICLRKSDTELYSLDEARLQSQFVNAENPSHNPPGKIPENDLSMKDWKIDESQSIVTESVGHTKPLEQFESQMTSTCIMSESAESKDLVLLTDCDRLKGPPTTNEENDAKRSESTNTKLEKTYNILISEDNSGKTADRQESTMVPYSENLPRSALFSSYSNRKPKNARAAVSDLSKRRINSPKPSKKRFSVIDIDLDSDPSVSSAPRTNFEELKQRLASVRLRAPPSPVPDELWNTADEILARFRSHDRGLNALGSDDAFTESTDKVDAAERRARSLSLLPRAVKKFEPLAHDRPNILTMSSNALNDYSPTSPTANDDDKCAKSQSLLDLRNNSRLSVFSGNDLMNQNKNLSKSELRLYESLQQLDIPDWFQNSARRQQEIVILKNARSIEHILSDCSFSSTEYQHKFEPSGPVAPKPVVITHYVRMPTYENKLNKSDCMVTEFELPSVKLREKSHSHFHPIKTRSFEEIMKSKIKINGANDEAKDEIEKCPGNLVSEEEESRKHSIEEGKLLPHEEIEMSFDHKMLPGQHSEQEMDLKSVAEMNTQSTLEELLPVAQQQSFKKDNDVHSSGSSEEKQTRRHDIRIGNPLPCDEILSMSGLTRKNSSHEERYPPSVAETQLLRRNSLKKSNRAFSEEMYPFSAAQKYSVKDQISSDSEGVILGRAETEMISSIRDSEMQIIRTRKLTKKSQNSELSLSGERKKKKLKNSCDTDYLENKELDADGTMWQIEQRQGQVGKQEEGEIPKEGKIQLKKKRSMRTGGLEEPTVKEASVSVPSNGDRLDEEINELIAYEQKRIREDSGVKIKRLRRKRSDVQETNGLQAFDNSNQTHTSFTDVDSGFTDLERNSLIKDDMQNVQADENTYKSLGRAVKLKKPKAKKISEREMEIIEFFGNQESVMHEEVADIRAKNSHRRKKSKVPVDFDLCNERLQEVANTSQLDLITLHEISTDDSFADQFKKSQRKVKTKFQEVDDTVVSIINISEPNERNTLEAGDPVISADNKVRVSRKKVKSRAGKDLDLSTEQTVQNSTDNREFTETSSYELNENSYDFQVSVSDAQKPLKKVKHKKLAENSENYDDRVHLNWEKPENNDNPSTRSNVLSDEPREQEEGRLVHDRVIRKPKKDKSIESLTIVPAIVKPKKKINEEDASVISSDLMKVRKRPKNRVSEVANSDQVVNDNDSATGKNSDHYMEQVVQPQVNHSRECLVSQDNLNDNQENTLSFHASSVASSQSKKTRRKRVTDFDANEAENGLVQSKPSQINQSPHQVKVRLVNANQRSAQYTADSNSLTDKARTAAALFSPRSGNRRRRAVDQLVEYEQQQF